MSPRLTRARQQSQQHTSTGVEVSVRVSKSASTAIEAAIPLTSMLVAGVMSGTSADGIDVALVRISPSKQAASPIIQLVGHTHVPYTKAVRAAVLRAMDAASTTTAELASLHTRLGQLYGEAIVQAQQQLGQRAQLCGIHGQTVFHQGAPARFLGTNLRCTLQIGEASEVAKLTGSPVINDFRPADMAAGGQGAPLVPVLDRALFAHATRNRILQNLGGIANMTALPANSPAVLAFDSGPANAVIDAVMQRLFGKRFDRNGTTAASGSPVPSVLNAALNLPYFSLPAPKSCGREQFGDAYVDRLIAACRKHRASDADIVATATALTSQTILHAYRTLVWPFLGQRAPLADATDYIVAGGGTKNQTLMRQLRAGLEPLGLQVQSSDALGMPAQAKEAVAFALLAWLRWHRLPGNIPEATGASRPMLLGKVTLP